MLPYTPGASRNCLILRGLTDFRVVKITTLKSSKSLIISVLRVAPLYDLTCFHHSNHVLPLMSRVVPPPRILLPLNPCYLTSDGAHATEFECFYHQIRTTTPPNPSCFSSGIRTTPNLRAVPPPNPICPTTASELFHIMSRVVPPHNPARNLKSQGEVTASRQI